MNILLDIEMPWLNGFEVISELKKDDKTKDIPLVARILAVANVYDTFISKRQYKEPILHKTAVEIVLKGRGTHFDPIVVDIFEQVHRKFRK